MKALSAEMYSRTTHLVPSTRLSPNIAELGDALKTLLEVSGTKRRLWFGELLPGTLISLILMFRV